MNRRDLQQLARQRSKDARALLDVDYPWGAYYLAGYAVECALKACIAKARPRHEFPDRATERDVYTHDLESLMKSAGLADALTIDMSTNASLRINWAVVKDWKETSRYEMYEKGRAMDLYRAINQRHDGILAWIIRQRW